MGVPTDKQNLRSKKSLEILPTRLKSAAFTKQEPFLLVEAGDAGFFMKLTNMIKYSKQNVRLLLRP
jgi:hypothetical protein